MKKNGEKKDVNAVKAIKEQFAALSIEDKVKVIDSLADPIKDRINKIIRDTYDSDFSGCSEFFIKNTCIYHNDPDDYKAEKCMIACSYDRDNFSFPLRWLDDRYDYMADYKKICDMDAEKDKARKEFEERDLLRRLKAKYEQ